MKKNIAIIFGSKSCEHDISIITALQIMSSIDKDHYNITPIYISADGVFFTGQALFDAKNYQDKQKLIKRCKEISFISGKPFVLIKKFKKFSTAKNIDVAILAVHGLNGEDGTLQGMLDLCHIPYTSCGNIESGICMNKNFMKDILFANGLPVVDYVSLTDKNDNNINLIKSHLSYPVIVKPSNLGSSIGIKIASTDDQLKQALDVAFEYDQTVLVERALENMIEINVGVCKIDGEIKTSNVEQPLSWSKFLTFEEKYLSKTSKTPSKNDQNQQNQKIDVSNETINEIKQLAKDAYKAFNLEGFVRIDMMFDKIEQKIFVNEINTIPGSLSFYLWKNHFKTFSDQLDAAIKIAHQKYVKKNSLTYCFKSDVLSNFSEKTNGQKIQD